MANNDRISEAYYGKFASSENQRICQDRISWMCDQVLAENAKVLDIGCSQGIASILLARSGHHVIGVDIEAPSIEYALAERDRETSDVRERLKFLRADILDSGEHVDLTPGGFDVVLLAEILEHLSEPSLLLKEAIGFLTPGGILVGAVPFGLHPHPDHKCTFYVSDLLALVKGICKIGSFTLVDGYIRFTAGRLDEPESFVPSLGTLLKASELQMLEREIRTDKQLSDRRVRLLKLEARVARLTTKNQDLAAKVETLRAVQKKRKQEDSVAAAAEEASRGADPIETRSSRGLAKAKGDASQGVMGKGLRVISTTLKLELRSGRILRQPVTSLKKTVARVGRVFRTPGVKLV